MDDNYQYDVPKVGAASEREKTQLDDGKGAGTTYVDLDTEAYIRQFHSK